MSTAHPLRIPVCVILPPKALLLDIAGPAEVLRRANVEQSAVRFEVRYYATSPSLMTSVGLRLADLAPLPDTLPQDAVVVLSGDAEGIMLPDVDWRPDGEDQDTANGNTEIVHWLAAHVRPDQLLVCICSGALLAARAGLLDGHACTTHYSCCAELARLAPGARVVENRLFVEDGHRLTSAGITAGVDLMLQLVSRLSDPLCALRVARHLVVYLRRGGSDPQFSPWLAGRNHLHMAVHRAQDAVAANLSAPWTLEKLAEVVGASPRHLSRLFNEHVAMSVPDYVGQLRVALTSELLRHTRLDLERIAEKVGFASTRQLRRVWAKYHAEPPSRARRMGADS